MKKNNFDLGLLNGNAYIKGKFKKLSIGIKGGKITHIGKLDSKVCKNIIELDGNFILPGIIDTQVHFREPGLVHKEDIYSGTKAAVLGGITTIFEMPNTSPATINAIELKRKMNIAKKNSWTNYAFFIGACKDNVSKLDKLESYGGMRSIEVKKNIY